MSSELNLKTVYNILYDIRRQWIDIGVNLEIDITKLGEIKDKYDKPGDCLREMIIIWLKKEPTWKALADALRSPSVNEEKVAKQGYFHSYLRYWLFSLANRCR